MLFFFRFEAFVSHDALIDWLVDFWVYLLISRNIMSLSRFFFIISSRLNTLGFFFPGLTEFLTVVSFA